MLAVVPKLLISLLTEWVNLLSLATQLFLITDTINPNGYFTLSNISGGTGGPYNFTWYDANGNLLQNSTSSTLDSLDVGTYSVVITDNSGCNSGIVSPITGLATIVFQMNLAPGCYKG